MKRLLPFIVLLVALLAGVVSFVVVLNPERHRAEITGLLSKAFNKPVSVGQMTMGYFPPTLRIAQVSAIKDGGIPFLEIDTCSAPLDLGSLLHIQIVPAALQFAHWKLMISRQADGHWDIEDWLSGLSSGKGNQGAYPVSWMEGEIHWEDPFANPPQDIVLGAVSGAWDPAKSALNTKGDFSGLGSPAHLSFTGSTQGGDVQLTDGGDSCAIHLEKKSGTWDMKGGSSQWPLPNALVFLKFYARASAKNVGPGQGLELHNWQFHATAARGGISFEHSAGISGGLVEAKGTLEAGLRARVEGAAKDIPADAFWAATGQDLPLSGNVTFLAKDVQLALSSGTAAILAGQGYWELKEGRYTVPPDSLKRLARAKTMAYFKKKFPDLQTTGLPIQRLGAHWQAKDGLIVVNDGLLVFTDVKAGWVGRVDSLRRGIDATIRLQMHERNPKLAALIPERYQTQPAFGRLQGTLQEWALRAVPSGRIPAALHSKLRKAINQR